MTITPRGRSAPGGWSAPISPSFFASPECRREVERFIEREKALNRNDLILPVYYLEYPSLSDEAAAQHDPLVRLFSNRQYADWCGLRFTSLNSKTVRQAMAGLAQRIRDAISGKPPPRLLTPEQHQFLEHLFQQPPVPDPQLRAWCHAAMPPDDPHTIPADVHSLGLLDWLVRRGQLAGGQVPLLIVLQQLLQPIADPDDRHRLQQAMESIARHFGITAIQPPAPAATADSPTLVLQLSLPAPGKRWDVQGWLFYSAERVRSVYPRTRQEGTTLNMDDVEAQTNLVEAMRKIVVERGVDPDRVMVEFILPQELWSHAVEHWVDEQGNPLGARFPVVVRPNERQKALALQMGWRQCWRTCRAGVFPNSLWWFEQFEEKWRRQVLDKLQQGACIALGFVPDILAPSRQNAILYLLHAGAPVVIWPRRQEGLAEFTQELPKFLATKPLQDLPRIIYDMRHELWTVLREQAACYDLTLLWDDPDRRPPKPQQDDEFYQGPGA
ncbi:MAG: hypothetical protein U1F76_28295 [Candidatus Competibacteraceae bacterium]